jgi:hypothetical protein
MIVSDLGLFRYEYHVRIGTVAAAQSYQRREKNTVDRRQ